MMKKNNTVPVSRYLQILPESTVAHVLEEQPQGIGLPSINGNCFFFFKPELLWSLEVDIFCGLCMIFTVMPARDSVPGQLLCHGRGAVEQDLQ
jgi:hypothetical protein